MKKAILENWWKYIGGQFWVGGWYGSPAYASFFREVCELEFDDNTWEKARAYEEALTSACWFWPHKHFVMACNRPAELHRNEQGRLHRETGMSIVWPDGWGLWYVHGVQVDEQIVMRPETQTVGQIDAEKSEEIRRIRIERYGWVRYLKDSKATVVDRRKNDIDQQHECLVTTPRGDRRLIVSDPSTARVYALGVPPDIQTCEQAQNWMNHGLRISHRS